MENDKTKWECYIEAKDKIEKIQEKIIDDLKVIKQIAKVNIDVYDKKGLFLHTLEKDILLIEEYIKDIKVKRCIK